MSQPIYSGIDRLLCRSGRRGVDDSKLLMAMRFVHSRFEGLIIEYRKSRESDTGSVLKKYLGVVGSLGDLLVDELDSFDRGIDKGIVKEETDQQI